MGAIVGLLRSYAAHQVAGFRYRASGLALLAIAAGVLLIAVAFALLAGFWALSLVLPPWQAALAMAGVALVTALILKLVAMRMIRRRTPFAHLTSQRLAATQTEPLSSRQQRRLGDPATLVIVAALTGVAVGRRLFR
jgi:MFS family permease